VAAAKYEYWLTEDGLILLGGWARDGLIDDQIAKNCDINVATLYDWKKRYPKIAEALKKNKEIVDYEVENALRDKALSGDVTAQIFWLKNRRPDKWRDKQLDGKIRSEENNLLEAITDTLEEDIETDDIQETE